MQSGFQFCILFFLVWLHANTLSLDFNLLESSNNTYSSLVHIIELNDEHKTARAIVMHDAYMRDFSDLHLAHLM